MTENAGGHVLDVGRRWRTLPPAMRRARQRRDAGCIPGCTNLLCVDAHHSQHSAHGGATHMDNLILLCRRHHRLVHEGGWHIVRGDGPILAPAIGAPDTGARVRPDGSIAEPAFDPRRWLAPRGANDAVTLALGPGAVPDVSAETYINRWCGEPLDYNVAIDAVLGQDCVPAAGAAVPRPAPLSGVVGLSVRERNCICLRRRRSVRNPARRDTRRPGGCGWTARPR